MDAAQKLSCLIGVLHAGETLAAHTAWRQSQLATLPWMRRALRIQAAQEHGHATLAAIALRHAGEPRHAPQAIAALRAQLDKHLDNGNLAASLLGLQGVIEHLGEALLAQLGRYQHPAGALLHRLRVRVLAQERGHVALGARCLDALGADADAVNDNPAQLQLYAELGRGTALQVGAMLDDALLDANAFWNDVQTRLIHWQQWPSGAQTPVA